MCTSWNKQIDSKKADCAFKEFILSLRNTDKPKCGNKKRQKIYFNE
jgi:hypothetical protein